MLALFEQYPLLKEKLPYISLGEFPTPIEKLERLGQAINAPRLFVKRDDISGKLYGGNKIRALEFLFGDAIHAGHKQVITLGFPASCQALAQAIYARELGLKSTAFLFPQIRSKQAQQHLLAFQSINADVRPTMPTIFPFLLRHRLKYGHFPKLLEASSPTGMIGYVNAGFELKNQIEQGLIPEPDIVYVSLATMGTTVGLMLGFKAAGLKSQIIGIENGARIMGRKVVTLPSMTKLFRETNELLHSNDTSFPIFEITESAFLARTVSERQKESLMTSPGIQAMAKAKELANLQLDEMFTANAFSALLEDGEAGYFHDKTVLWWNTYNTRDLPSQIKSVDYRKLHKSFHQYFESSPL